ncbi:MAG TPA: hypothetical protein VEI97_15165, partial [bacterium]|nr:hypothetical protein [bacterium]
GVWFDALQAGDFAQYSHNDFEAVVIAQHPDLGRMLDQLRALGATALLTGSGSALVGLYGGEGAAKAAAARYGPVAGERVVVVRAWDGPSVTLV